MRLLRDTYARINNGRGLQAWKRTLVRISGIARIAHDARCEAQRKGLDGINDATVKGLACSAIGVWIQRGCKKLIGVMTVEQDRDTEQGKNNNRQRHNIHDCNVGSLKNTDVKGGIGASQGGKQGVEFAEEGTRKWRMDDANGDLRTGGRDLGEGAGGVLMRRVDGGRVRQGLQRECGVYGQAFGTAEPEVGVHEGNAHRKRCVEVGRRGGDKMRGEPRSML